jgi:hypothetical protein
LHVRRIAPGSGSSAGGSGVVSLGTYLLRFTDANQHTSTNHKAVFTPAYPSTTMTWNTFARMAVFGSPSPFNVDLNAGSFAQRRHLDRCSARTRGHGYALLWHQPDAR